MTTPQLFHSLFFVTDKPLGRGLPGKLGADGKMTAGPWRDTRKKEGVHETDDRAISPDMIARHLAGTLLQNGYLAMLMPYMVDGDGRATCTAIDMDIAGKGHADLPQHFDTIAEALAAVQSLLKVCAELGLRAWVETTKGGGRRLWIFHHRLPAADARDLGLLLLKHAGLHPMIEVFPKQALARLTGNGVFLPYFGGAAPGRQVITDPVTGEALSADEFAAAAIGNRTVPSLVASLVQPARDGGEIAVRRAPSPRQERPEGEDGERGDVSPAMWPVQVEKCAYLDALVKRAESGQELAYEDWVLVATHLRVYGSWGRQEFHRLSEFDGRYDPIETDHKIDSLTGGPRRCDTTPCGKDAHADCGLPEGKVSSIHWAYRGVALRMAAQAGGAFRYSPPADWKDAPETSAEGGAMPSGGSRTTSAADAQSMTLKQDFAQTDIGNGQRLAVRHGQDLHYCHDWAKWLIWDGHRWRKDNTGEIDRRAKETARHVFQEAADCSDTAKQTELAKHAVRSQSHARLQSMTALANSEPGIPATPTEWDKNPWQMAVDNGTINLKTGELCESRRADMGTKRAGTHYNPEAAAPRWETFLETVLPDPAARAFFQRAAGYALTGDVSAQCLFFLYGSGSNGKSTALRALMDTMGDYALQAAPDLLIAREGTGGPNNDVAELQGARLVATIEVEDGKRMAEGLVKQITGGDRIKARFMRQDYFEFEPTHKIFLAANHKPPIRGQDVAIWRRIKVLPFEVQIADADKDPHLLEKLRAEMPGILAWAVRGCLDWQQQGLAEPEAVKEATAAYQAGEDVLGDFLGECCLLRPALRVTAAALYSAYIKWAEENSERPLSKKNFGARLQEGRRIFPASGIGPKSARGWEGIGLIDTESRPAFDSSFDKTDKSDPQIPMNRQVIKPRGDHLENTSDLSVLSVPACTQEVLEHLAKAAPVKHRDLVAAMMANGHPEEEAKRVIAQLQQHERRIEFDVSAGGYVLAEPV